MFGMMCQIAEFERELIRERVKAGMAEAKSRGIHTGRKHRLLPHQRTEAARMHQEGRSIGAIAAMFGCGRTVVHRAISGSAQYETPRTMDFDHSSGDRPSYRLCGGYVLHV